MSSAGDEQEQLRAARELIRDKRYDEARALLASLNHPLARVWLARLEPPAPVVAPPPPAEGSAVLGALVALIVLVFSTAIFLVARQSSADAPPVQSVAVAATPGCPVGEWWTQINTLFARAEFNSVDPAQAQGIDARAAALKQTRADFAALATPDCLAAARADLLKAVDAQIDAFGLFDATDAAPMMTRMYDALLAYQTAGNDLHTLGVTFDSSTTFSQSLQSLTGDCPAQLWVLETFYVKNDFFKLIDAARTVIYASDPAAAAQNYVFDLSGAELKLQYAPNPPCVGPAKAHLLAAMDAFVQFIQAYQGRDGNGMGIHLQTMQTELRSFQTALKTLGIDVDLGLQN